jgi:hypothetical protein
MPTKTTLTAMAATLVLLFGLLGCASMGGDPTPYEGYTNVYLQNNIHGYTKAARGGKTEYIASYANYVQPDTGHFFVPVNTAVSVGQIPRGIHDLPAWTTTSSFISNTAPATWAACPWKNTSI